MQLPEVLDSPAREPLLKDGEMRGPTPAKILETARALDSAMRQHEPSAVAVGKQLIGDVAVLPTLESRFEQPRRLEPDHLLGPDCAFEAFVALRVRNLLGRQLVVIDQQFEFADAGR